MTEESLSPWQQYKKNLGETRPWDLLNPAVENCTDTEQKTRMDICNGCPELIDLTKQCKKCGCIMPLKTRLKKAVCPIGKW
jgi:hypothetical protein